MNYMQQVAEMLGVRLGEKFKIDNDWGWYYFDVDGCRGVDKGYCREVPMYDLLTGRASIRMPWIPQDGDEYWFGLTDGSVAHDVWNRNTDDFMRYSARNYFRTKGEAEVYALNIIDRLQKRMDHEKGKPVWEQSA